MLKTQRCNVRKESIFIRECSIGQERYDAMDIMNTIELHTQCFVVFTRLPACVGYSSAIILYLTVFLFFYYYNSASGTVYCIS